MSPRTPEALERARQRVRDRRMDPDYRAKEAHAPTKKLWAQAHPRVSTPESKERDRNRRRKKRQENPTLLVAARRNTEAYRKRLQENDPEAYEAIQRLHREKRQKFQRDGTPKVYFIQTSSGPIKIGFTTTRMESRLQTLQCGSFESLRILGFMVVSNRKDETKIHDRFRHLRIRPKGEWFRPEEELLQFITSLSSGETFLSELSEPTSSTPPESPAPETCRPVRTPSCSSSPTRAH